MVIFFFMSRKKFQEKFQFTCCATHNKYAKVSYPLHTLERLDKVWVAGTMNSHYSVAERGW